MRNNKNRKQEDKSFSTKVDYAGELMKFLLARLPRKNRDNIKSLLKYKQVRVDGKIITQFNYPLAPGQQVTVSEKEAVRERSYSGFSIVYEDPYLIVIDKHAGVLSVASSGEKHHTAYRMLSDYVKTQDAENKIFIVHRLDRDTSGLMMFARSEEMQARLQGQWKDSKPLRLYLAVVEGRVEKEVGVIQSYIRENKSFTGYSEYEEGEGQLAVTHFRKLKSNDRYSLLEIRLETGRKNQIRIHMKDMGHCILGDKKYGASGNPIARLGLHAFKLSFALPVSGESLQFEIPAPRKFSRVI